MAGIQLQRGRIARLICTPFLCLFLYRVGEPLWSYLLTDDHLIIWSRFDQLKAREYIDLSFITMILMPTSDQNEKFLMTIGETCGLFMLKLAHFVAYSVTLYFVRDTHSNAIKRVAELQIYSEVLRLLIFSIYSYSSRTCNQAVPSTFFFRASRGMGAYFSACFWQSLQALLSWIVIIAAILIFS